MSDILLFIWLLVSTILIIVYFYQIVVATAGFRNAIPAPSTRPTQRFAVIIPAHNEEHVIFETVKSIIRSRYPRDLFDVIVVADNCYDLTADEAKTAGAKVLIRSEPYLTGKGEAMKWVFERLGMDSKYDAFVIIDADNIVSRNFLKKMNDELNNGHGVIQGYLGSKNPNDNWVTRTIFVTYAFINRFFELSRENLGLCVALGGTGVCIRRDLLKKYGWDFTSLTEDLELTTKLAMDGIKVRFAYDAKVYDEKPKTLYSALKQRQRWMHGHATIMMRYGFKLLRNGIIRRDPLSLDASFYILLPLLMTIWLIVDITRVIVFWGESIPYPVQILDLSFRYLNIAVVVAFALWWLIVPLYAVKLEGERPKRYWFGSIVMVLMAWIMLILFIVGLLSKRDMRWWHTKHDASLDISIDVER